MTEKSSKFEVWPYAIIAAFVLFGAFIFGSVYIMVSEKVDLVSPDYYKDEIEFQNQIDKRSRAVAAGKKIYVEQDKESAQMRVKFPGSGLEGQLNFFRPSDAAADKKFSVRSDSSGIVVLPLGQFASGSWKLKAEWKEGGEEYFDEQPIIIP